MSEFAKHGGAFFTAVGEDFQTLEKSKQVVSADVLDAWFDPAPSVLERLREYLPFLARTSPPVHADGMLDTIAEVRGLPRESILAGAGSSSLLFECLPRLISAGQAVVQLQPTYSEYEHLLSDVIGARVLGFNLEVEQNFLPNAEALANFCRDAGARALVLVNPNNPTGRLWPRSEVEVLLAALPEGTLVLADETYIEFASEHDSLEKLAAVTKNLLVLKSMSKVYALSGLRAGYLVGEPQTIRDLARWVPPWPVSLMAQLAAVEALRNTAYYRQRWSDTRELRAAQSLRLHALPSDSNWILVPVSEPHRVAESLRQRMIYVREFDAATAFGQSYLRIAIKDDQQNQLIARAVHDAS